MSACAIKKMQLCIGTAAQPVSSANEIISKRDTAIFGQNYALVLMYGCNGSANTKW